MEEPEPQPPPPTETIVTQIIWGNLPVWEGNCTNPACGSFDHTDEEMETDRGPRTLVTCYQCKTRYS